ncbi:hypothetical protein [Pseudomonas costantinii]|uniref:Fap n=1 Tax=Pseudomonas costantinii TaxID=168469 RepID=A0A1S2V016_9PSED|nr:hypothetical protein [Pseudomonas costantinii]NVZ23311.1 hypothetical protein [Pseudomonas costantinii]OIN52037.1 hypothetical protein BFL40_14550 [Pseudomonas costantinii]SEE48621.1 hypothetical protein SAMN04515675_5822 [Pseudomonas costantinii]
MDTHNPGSLSLLLISCVLSASVSLPVLAAGDIVIQRTVQGHMAGRSPGVDPNPTTVNANPSALVVRTTSELSDNDIAGISSGASLNRLIMPGGNVTGLNTLNGNSIVQGAGSMAGGSGAGNGISGTINGAVSRGLEPLNNISSMLGGH